VSIERDLVDIGALIQRVVEEAQTGLERHKLAFIPPDDALAIIGDELRLEQVIQNLVQNAIKYSPNGGLVEVRAARRGAMACISVTDQGMGIPQAALSRLFTRFYRAPNVDPQHISGMGVGLYVVKEIVSLHGGEADVESQEGVGSTFTICLPLMSEA
jgi:signal transduction histidine kinase